MAVDPYVNILFNGTLPAARGKIAKQLMDTTPAQQRQQSEEISTFLNPTNNPNLHQCNADNSPAYTFVMGIPGTTKLKFVYGIGFGASGIGATTPLDGKILLLTGEGGGSMGPPTSLVLPQSAVTVHQVPTMTEDQLLAKMETLGATYSWPVLARTHINETSTQLHIVPCPTYLCCDGLDGNIDAFELYERIMSLDDSTGAIFVTLKQYIRAFLSASNAADEKPTAPLTDILAPTPEEAKRWAESKFNSLFPTLVQAAAPAPPGMHQPPPGAPPGFPAFWATMMAQMNMANMNMNMMGGTPGGLVEEKKDDTPEEKLGIAPQELNALRDMCGLRNSDSNDKLPRWFHSISEKGMTEAFKLQLVRPQIEENIFYHDAEVVPTNILLKMAVKRNWVGKDGNAQRPSLLHAADGLSPFAVADYNDDEVAVINDMDDSVAKATSTSPEDHQKMKKLMKVAVPTTSEDFTLMIRRYANLVFALFGPLCYLFLALKQLIDCLRGYSRQVLNAMPQLTRASILWIILLQSRHFAMGHTDILAAFANLQTKLASKDGYISHMEVPKALYDSSSNKRKTPDDPDKENPGDDKKRLRPPNKNKWHPALQKALFPALKKSNFPTFTKIMKFCGADVNVPFSQKDKICAPNAFFGRCSSGDKCRKSHALISDEQAKEILKILDKFVRDPDGCANSKS